MLRRRRGCRQARLVGNSGHQPLPGTRGRLGSSGRQREQAEVAAQLFYFAAAGGASVQMLFERMALRAVERSERVERQVFRELFVHGHTASTFRNASNPARILVLIVPSGSPVFPAISE